MALSANAQNKLNLPHKSHLEDRVTGKIHSEADRTKEALKRFENEIFPAHNAKWGEWYFFYTHEAFRKLHEADSNLGSQSPTTPKDHPARDSIRRRPTL